MKLCVHKWAVEGIPSCMFFTLGPERDGWRRFRFNSSETAMTRRNVSVSLTVLYMSFIPLMKKNRFTQVKFIKAKSGIIHDFKFLSSCYSWVDCISKSLLSFSSLLLHYTNSQDAASVYILLCRIKLGLNSIQIFSIESNKTRLHCEIHVQLHWVTVSPNYDML